MVFDEWQGSIDIKVLVANRNSGNGHCIKCLYNFFRFKGLAVPVFCRYFSNLEKMNKFLNTNNTGIERVGVVKNQSQHILAK